MIPSEDRADEAPVGLRPQQNRDVVLTAEARRDSDTRKRATVSMLAPAEDTPVSIVCDEGSQRGGRGEQPNALAYFTSSIAFCMLSQLSRTASVLKLDVSNVRVSVKTQWHIEGSVLAGTVQSEPLVFNEQIEFDSSEPEEDIQRFVETSERSCYVMQSLSANVEREVIVNGERVDLLAGPVGG